MTYLDFDNATPQPPRKTGLLSETNLKVVAGILTVIGGSLSFLGQHPRGYWVFIALAVLVLGWILLPQVFAICRRIIRWRSNKRYVTREFPRLKRFYDRFMPFISQNDMRSFRYLLSNSSTSQNSVVTTIIGFDYLPVWIDFYAEHLKSTPTSVLDFLSRCNEFTAIVTQFNRYYVIKAQQGLERTPFQQDHFTDRFEQFREDFVQYLRELEDWVNSIYVEARKRAPEVFQHPLSLPTSSFERPGSFRPKKTSAV